MEDRGLLLQFKNGQFRPKAEVAGIYKRAFELAIAVLARDIGLDKSGQLRQRLLPA